MVGATVLDGVAGARAGLIILLAADQRSQQPDDPEHPGAAVAAASGPPVPSLVRPVSLAYVCSGSAVALAQGHRRANPNPPHRPGGEAQLGIVVARVPAAGRGRLPRMLGYSR
jgi:hypothetical protein